MNGEEIPLEIKAWAAGFWEGEGSVTIHKELQKGHTRYSLRSTVGQKREEPLKLLEYYWGGRVHLSLQNGKSYRWVVANRAAALFLGDIYPYLKFRGEQVATGLEFRRLINPLGVPISKENFDKRSGLRERLLTLNGYYRRKGNVRKEDK